MNYPPLFRSRPWAGFAALALLGLPISGANAGVFNWANVPGNWSVAGNWGGIAPTGFDATDVLNFGGDVGTAYTATNDIANPFLLNQLVFNATDTGALGTTNIIAGSALRFAGATPQITATGAGGFRVDAAIQLTAPLTLTGNGTGVITLNNTVSGTFDITKNGTSTFRFGSQTIPGIPPTELASDNTWFGTLTINDGIVRFNNNATVGRTALRSNPVVLNSATAKLTVSSELRVGTLSGSLGTVESQVTGNDDNENIVIHTLSNGTFGGTIHLARPPGSGNDGGTLVIRGAGTQTLSGTVQIYKDVSVGRGATLVLSGTASLAIDDQGLTQTRGAVVMNGGTFKLDNTAGNVDRLRPGAADSTGLDTIGGGIFSLIGNLTGTTEFLGRLQLGSVNNGLTKSTPRSGALNINVTHSGGSTILSFAAYTRDNRTSNQYTTVDFSANNSSGTSLLLGQTGAGPRIAFTSFGVPMINGLLNNTGVGVGSPAGTSDTGWATVNGTDFATYSSTLNNGTELGIQAVATVAFPSGTGGTATNAILTGDGSISSATNFSLNSLKIAPLAAGGHLDITAAGNLNNRNYILGGAEDYTIQNTGGGTGGIAGAITRYFHVQQATLSVNVSLAAGAGLTAPIVKAGAGTLALGANNSAINTVPLVINAGTVRSTVAFLPQGELRLRGGVYEIDGGGAATTFSRAVSFGSGTVNWSGIDSVTAGNPGIDEDRGSGGFSAYNAGAAGVTIDLGVAGPTLYAWEDKGFLNSGHALIFGSTKADSRITWSDNLSLTATSGVVNYQAREIRVNDNPSVVTDIARISGAISGNVQSDLLKTGPGTLELTGSNTYLGATLVTEGTLLINSNSSASSFLTNVRNGGTLGGRSLVGTSIGAVRVETGGTLAPGQAAGTTSILNTGELRFAGPGAKLSIDLGGLSAGGNGTTGYDQVNVAGGVILDGDLTGSLLSGFAPQLGDLFFIIINDGSDAVQGTFQTVNIGGQSFEISYTGDSVGGTFIGGNDVVLRAIPEPSSAMLAVAGLSLLGLRRRRA